MQAYIKYKAYYDKKAHASELNERDNVYVLQPKAGHQGNKIPLTDFQWTAPFFSPALTTWISQSTPSMFDFSFSCNLMGNAAIFKWRYWIFQMFQHDK